MHERRLQVEGDEDCRPGYIDALTMNNRRNQWQDNERNLEEVEEEREKEVCDIDAPGQEGVCRVSPIVAAGLPSPGFAVEGLSWCGVLPTDLVRAGHPP
jgi:hypothetical protein